MSHFTIFAHQQTSSETWANAFENTGNTFETILNKMLHVCLALSLSKYKCSSTFPALVLRKCRCFLQLRPQPGKVQKYRHSQYILFKQSTGNLFENESFRSTRSAKMSYDFKWHIWPILVSKKRLDLNISIHWLDFGLKTFINVKIENWIRMCIPLQICQSFVYFQQTKDEIWLN